MAKRVELIKEKIEREKRILFAERTIAFIELVLLVCIFSLLIRGYLKIKCLNKS